jgi:glyoxylase-like metal-dependent hydrolase (beta-lactamase superfamily II)
MKPEVKAFFDEQTSTLTYVVWDASTRDALVIDPVLDFDPGGAFTWTRSVDEVSAFLRDNELSLRWVLETHAHADHLSGSQILRRRFGAGVVIGERIVEVQETFKNVFDLGADFATDGSQFDRLVADGETLGAGSLRVEVIATPGHTPACVSYRIGDTVFTGDALFMDDYGTGRTDFPKGSASDLWESVQRLYRLPDETRVFVGHDYKPGGRELRWETTIGISKKNNPQLKADTSRDEFVRFRNERDAKLSPPKLLFPSVQVNVNAGRLPAARNNGIRYLSAPLNFARAADELGEPIVAA